jgi:F-type H+-transporting ATPase subunit b
LEKLGFHIPSLIVYIVNFLLLLAILYFFAYKRILAMMDRRSERIRESLEAADRAKEEADRAREDMRGQIAESRRESQAVLEQARQAAERHREEAHLRAQEEAKAFLERARRDIELERDRAINEVRRHFSELAIMAAEKVVRRSLDRDAHKELVEEVLKEGGELPEG